MNTKFNVGDTVLIEGTVDSIYVETTDNEPVYRISIKGAGSPYSSSYGIHIKEDIMEGGAR